MDLLSTIKHASMAAVSASNPAAVMFGIVTSAEPLEIHVDQRFTLPATFLVIPESLTRYELDLSHEHAYVDTSTSGSTTRATEGAFPDPIIIRRGLDTGDKVLLLRMQGGQQYVILDRMVNADDT